MKIDVLILYESKNREIESLCFLQQEIINKGYSCKILSIYDPTKYFYKAGVLIVPHLYDDNQLKGFGLNLWRSNTKIISLQWEQVLVKGMQDIGIHNPKGQAKYAHHIAWGKDQELRYIKHGIEPSNIWTTGSISMDLLNDRFTKYFLTKEEIGEKLNIDPNKEWVLFISSFSCANFPLTTLHKFSKKNPTIYEFAELCTATSAIIVDWFKRAAELFPDKIIIYRPHPGELHNEITLSELQKQNNIKIVSEFSMRQWVKVADHIYNWCSTSLADIYFAKKGCHIIRPISVPEKLDFDIFDDLQKITSFNDFIESMKSEPPKINSSLMNYYYGSPDNGFAYEKITNLVDNLLQEKIPGHNFKYSKKNWFYISDSNSIISNLKNWVGIFFFYVCRFFMIKKIPFLPKVQHILNIYKTNIYGINKDIKNYNKKIILFFR